MKKKQKAEGLTNLCLALAEKLVKFRNIFMSLFTQALYLNQQVFVKLSTLNFPFQ